MNARIPVIDQPGNGESLDGQAILIRDSLQASIDLWDLRESRRLGISVEEVQARFAKRMAEDTAAEKKFPVSPAPDEDHYESKKLAVNTGERRIWE
jgi:hypothetical protein